MMRELCVWRGVEAELQCRGRECSVGVRDEGKE